MAPCRRDLFGGERPWGPADWTATDDRVRGGESQSYFDCAECEPTARFYGTLDIDALGGAGFASQRTTGASRTWDLSAFDGVELELVGAAAEAKRYAFTLKDTLLPQDADTGRERAAVSYEYDFTVRKDDVEGAARRVRIPFADLTATYRGREKEDAPPLDTESVKRFGFMMRSFFGEQKGDFSLEIRSIAAYKDEDEDDESAEEHTASASAYQAAPFPYPYRDAPEENASGALMDEKFSTQEQASPQGFFCWLFQVCTDCVRRR